MFGPLHISHSNTGGGADIAATRIHRAELASGMDSRMAVAKHVGDDPTVLQLPQAGGWPSAWAREHLTDLALWTQLSRNPVHRSLNLVPSGALGLVSELRPSVVHLHWMGSDTMSVAEIGWLAAGGPVVWTLHDSWAFTGAEHHPEDAGDNRFTVGYTPASRRPGSGRFDLDASAYRRKAKHWRSPMWLAAPSQFMADLAARSVIARGWPSRVIPNPLDTDVFKPLPANEIAAARATFGLPTDQPVVLFGASPNSAFNKGWDLLKPALRTVAERVPGAVAVVFGVDAPAAPPAVGMPVHYIGRVDDPARLATLYAASTVMVVPSRLESFSQTASEAQASGTPVVAFATSGLLDVVDTGVTGLLAEPFSSADLADAIERILTDKTMHAGMSTAARERALRLWSPAVVAAAYANWYDEAIRGQRADPT